MLAVLSPSLKTARRWLNQSPLFQQGFTTWALVVTALLAGALTMSVLLGQRALHDPQLIYWLLFADVTLLLIFGSRIIRHIVLIVYQRRQLIAGAQLHAQLIRIFSLLALVPALVMGLCAAIFITVVVQQWFGPKVKEAIDSAQSVAEAYLTEHQQTIRADLLAMATDLTRISPQFFSNPADFEKAMRTQVLLRNLREAYIFDSKGRVLMRAGFRFWQQASDFDDASVARAREGEVVIHTDDSTNQVYALTRLYGFGEMYLAASRGVDAQVLEYTTRTEQAANAYHELEGRRAGLQKTLTLVFVVVTLLLVLAAVGAGLWFAERLVQPLVTLLAAAEKVRGGDLTVRVKEASQFAEINELQRAFNRMTGQLGQIHNLERQAAWSDVAKRIAHEIKNPLTPIMLAAERLRRKYGKEVQTDPEVFATCIETIIRQVSHVGRMVNDFAQFARLPQPQLYLDNLVPLGQQAIALQREAQRHIQYTLSAPEELVAPSDAGLIGQALTNLLQNAANALNERPLEVHETQPGMITMRLRREEQYAIIEVIDNGPGWPDDTQERLLEPYVTTRENGSGIGLAMVRKITEDHGGKVVLTQRNDGAVGAVVQLWLPL